MNTHERPGVNRHHESDVVVVGGGLAGLTAAAYVARAGKTVTLFESGELGGRAVTRAPDGFHLNLGPHALYRGGDGVAVLQELGVRYEGEPPPTSSGAFVLDGGKLHALPSGLRSLVTTGLFGFRAKQEVATLLTRMERLDPEAFAGETVAAWLQREIREDVVRRFMEALFRLGTYANDPQRASAGATLAQFQLAAQGVLYLHGGWQTLVEGLASAAWDAGAALVPQTRVRRLLRSGCVQGVELEDGTEHRARCVILTARPPVVGALVAPEIPESVRRAEAEAIPARAACLDLALRRLPRPDVLFTLGVDEPLYLSVHSASARLAPEGGAVIHVAQYLGSEPTADPGAVEKRLEALLDQCQPGWRLEVVDRRYAPNMIVTNAVVRADRNGYPGRAGAEVPEIPGLYLAGDWIGPAGMLADASFASGREAAHRALADAGRDEVASLGTGRSLVSAVR